MSMTNYKTILICFLLFLSTGVFAMPSMFNKDGVLHFVEVKTRNGDQYGYPSESVTAAKQLRIKRAAEQYLQGRRSQWNKLYFDV